MDRIQKTRIDGSDGVTLYRDSPRLIRVVFVGSIDIETVHHWLLEKVRLANEEGATRFLLNIERSIPNFPPSDMIEEVEYFADNTPKGMRIAYVSSEMRLARHFMMIRAAAFAKGLDVAVFDTEDEARAWLER